MAGDQFNRLMGRLPKLCGASGHDPFFMMSMPLLAPVQVRPRLRNRRHGRSIPQQLAVGSYMFLFDGAYEGPGTD